eukprot:364929-Chlamydomonas_euryale.AAC.4
MLIRSDLAAGSPPQLHQTGYVGGVGTYLTQTLVTGGWDVPHPNTRHRWVGRTSSKHSSQAGGTYLTQTLGTGGWDVPHLNTRHRRVGTYLIQTLVTGGWDVPHPNTRGWDVPHPNTRHRRVGRTSPKHSSQAGWDVPHPNTRHRRVGHTSPKHSSQAGGMCLVQLASNASYLCRRAQRCVGRHAILLFACSACMHNDALGSSFDQLSLPPSTSPAAALCQHFTDFCCNFAALLQYAVVDDLDLVPCTLKNGGICNENVTGRIVVMLAQNEH